ncbi:MAG: SPOR domain-containing protein [Tannerella sp.]|jgi:hypothetical protein|nr:SPOR domain-containing protein [Tannerella sp.]
MKPQIIISLFVMLLSVSGGISAQSVIFDVLSNNSAGKGGVVIHQSNAVRRLVGMIPEGAKTEEENGRRYLLVPGYRVQVFSGNNQRQAKDEAFAKERQIKQLYPEMATYVRYRSPFWSLRVGDFTSYEEALNAKYNLDKSFPSFKHEINVFKEEEVRILLD